jgi:hypothetical protein
MTTRNRDSILWIAVNLTTVISSVYFTDGYSRRMLVAVLIVSLISVNLTLFLSVRSRNRRDRLDG